MSKGAFITFEGVEGAGKSTQVALLKAELEKRNINSTVVREPGGTQVGEAIRELIFRFSSERLHNKTELFLFMASRIQLLEEVIIPALAEGRVVLCDRYYDATVAYQGYGRNIPLNLISEADKVATNAFRPDITLLFDLDTRTGLERTRQRKVQNRVDLEGMQFHDMVRKGYLEIAKKNPERFSIIDAGAPADKVSLNVREVILPFLKQRLALP